MRRGKANKRRKSLRARVTGTTLVRLCVLSVVKELPHQKAVQTRTRPVLLGRAYCILMYYSKRSRRARRARRASGKDWQVSLPNLAAHSHTRRHNSLLFSLSPPASRLFQISLPFSSGLLTSIAFLPTSFPRPVSSTFLSSCRPTPPINGQCASARHLHSQQQQSSQNVIDPTTITIVRLHLHLLPSHYSQSASTTVFCCTAYGARELFAKNICLHMPSRRDSSHSVSRYYRNVRVEPYWGPVRLQY